MEDGQDVQNKGGMSLIIQDGVILEIVVLRFRQLVTIRIALQ